MMLKNIMVLLFISIIVLGSCNRTADKKESQQDSIATTTADSLPNVMDTLAVPKQEIAQEESIDRAISNIVRAYSMQDSKALNSYIDKTIGLYTIYRPGVQAIYVHATSIDFNHPIPEYYPYPKPNLSGKVTFGILPVYDCGKEAWNKKGLFCNNKQHPTELSQTAKFMNEILEAKISDAEIQKLKALEAKSYRVILTDKNAPLIFHITKQSNRWVLTVIDRAYGSCDA